MPGLGERDHALFRILIRTSIDGVLVMDEDGTVLIYNEACRGLFQHPPESVLGNKANMLLAFSSQADFRAWIAKASAPGEMTSFSARYEVHGQRKDGSHFPLQVSLQEGELEGKRVFLAVLHDLTALYRARMEHDEEKAYLALIIESANDAIISYALDGKVRSWNRAAEQMFGYQAEEVIGVAAINLMPIFIPKDLIKSEEAIFARALSGETIAPYETIRLHRNGTSVPLMVSAAPIRDGQGRIVGIARNARDIRERRAFEAQYALLSDIVASSSDAIISYALDGTITSWNRAAELTYGYTSAEMVGGNFYDRIGQFMAPEQVTVEREIVHRVVAGERVPPYEATRIRKDGMPAYVLVSVSPIRSANGTVMGTSRMVRDLTEQKTHEQDRAILNMAINSSDEGFTCIGLDGTVLTWNSGAEKMLGYAAAEMVGGSARDVIPKIVPSELVALEFENSRRASAGERIEPYRSTRIRKDGTLVPVISIIRSIRNSDGKILAISRSLHDMTERLEFEQQRALLSSIVEFSNDAILSRTLDGIVTSWNAAAEAMFGYTAAEIIGQPFQWVIPDDGIEEERRLLATIGEGGTIRQFETLRRRKDGSVFDVSISASPLRDSDGSIIGVSATVRDITERKDYERRLNGMREDMIHVARMQEMSQVSAGIAHEMNQPLAAMLNYSNAARRLVANGDPESIARLPEVTGRIATQAERASQIIKRMRDFVEKRTPHRDIDNINTIADDAVALALIGAKIANIEFHFEHTLDAAPVLVDRVQVQQVLVNLLRNAVEAMSDSTCRELTLTITNQDHAFVEVMVSDTGRGITPHIADNLFTPFVTTKENSMGIGLAISKSIIEAHGGTLTAAPRAEGGTIFRFTLPAATA
ncbi:MAG: PAS domain S-box protein [Rhizomicrobium sp.]|nr:PAS domain S-box protein [Rhizomicrobium sp.]